ncbi:MAG TPA: hypothetical protein PKD05_16220, partial [Candidatus Melainabacteria bacterium]|nr:hypothetical protein [Candidatus Melainabacteria bacterium]
VSNRGIRLCYLRQAGIDLYGDAMKFAKIVFLLAGIYGLVVIAPLYFLEGAVVAQSGKVVNHPEFYYGFAGVTLAWQIGFLLISTDPVRYRLLMFAACIEKLSFVAAIAVLYAQGRVDMTMVFGAAGDFVLLCLFVAAIVKTAGQRYVSDAGS